MDQRMHPQFTLVKYLRKHARPITGLTDVENLRISSTKDSAMKNQRLSAITLGSQIRVWLPTKSARHLTDARIALLGEPFAANLAATKRRFH